MNLHTYLIDFKKLDPEKVLKIERCYYNCKTNQLDSDDYSILAEWLLDPERIGESGGWF